MSTATCEPVIRSRHLVPLLVAGWLFFGLTSLWTNVLQEQRQVREFLGLMPFSDVQVDGVHIVNNKAFVWGTMVKRRCEFQNLSAMVSDGAAPLHLALIDTSPERRGAPDQSRPSEKALQSWGQWIIAPRDPEFIPTRWRIYATHQCPEDAPGVPQTNWFAAGDWADWTRAE